MKFIGDFLAVITSIVYSIVLFAMAGVLVVSNIFSADYYTEVLNDINVKEMKLSDFGITNIEEDKTVEAIVVETLIEAGISESDATKIVNNEKINEVAGKFISDTTKYLIVQEDIPQLDVKNVKEILESEEMSGIVGNASSEMNAEEITYELNKLIKDMIEGEVSYGE